MRNSYKFLVLIIVLFTMFNCTKKEDLSTDLQINNFIWKGLNDYYLWQGEVNDLNDNRFSNQNKLNNFIDGKSPSDLFESLLFERGTTDKWSWIVEDYIALEQLFSGVSKTNGMNFGLVAFSDDENEIFGYVRYIIPNSQASSLGVQRGDIIYGINGERLTRSNYQDLLSQENYTVNFGTYDQSGSTASVVPNNVNITLNKEQLAVNPIHTVLVHEVDGHRIGYIFYNQFVSNYDGQLNAAFLYLKNQNITDLVLDLRYNGGGSVNTAINLASMITGQFNGELFATERWNSKWQSYLEAEQPGILINNFTDKLSDDGGDINSLNLSELTVIVTSRSASASELVINGLKPYINVNLVGTTTHGKYVGSVTLYDSDSFRRNDNTLNTEHHFAMQPIVLEIVNKLGENNKNGFVPANFLRENYADLGQIGSPTEPLFELAIQHILGLRRSALPKSGLTGLKTISDSHLGNPFYSNMYVDLR